MKQARSNKHEVAKRIRSGQHIPDILDCLAQLSNDEVPTPPKHARAMLDLLPDEVWGKVDYLWLDPFCKSGIFLREAAGRLLEGLSEQIPDFAMRRDHVYRNMLWGTSITEMTGMISRRSLYCSRDASGPASVVQLDHEDGNIPWVRTTHTFPKKKDGTVTGGCTICGAPFDLERGQVRENHAYSFIHGAYPTEEMKDMKFDVIVGNPPYQLKDGGHSASATQIYQHFVKAAMDLNPRYVLMITKSNWFSGGKGLSAFRRRMLADKSIRHLVDFPKLYDVFPGVKIRGGVSYFLWDRAYHGPCQVQTMWDGEPLGPPTVRYLDQYDVLVRRNEAVSILEKVRAYRTDGKPEDTLDKKVSSMKPFGLRTFFHGADTPDGMAEPVKLYGSQRVSWIERADIPQNTDWVNDWKVLVSRVQGTSAAVETLFLGNPIVSGPKEACTETYVVAGRFDDEKEAERYATYLRTRFARLLVSLRKSTQDSPKDVYGFIPDLRMDREWTDSELYARYDLTEVEIEFIESHVAKRLSSGEARLQKRVYVG